jgi:D-serine dehydratase
MDWSVALLLNVWTTGRSMVPEEQYQAMLRRGTELTQLD